MGRREAAAESAKGIFRVIGGAIKGVNRKDGEDWEAQIETLQVQKKTLMDMNRSREQEVLNLRKKMKQVEETAANRLRKVARRNALSEEQQAKEIHVFMSQIQVLETQKMALQAQIAASQLTFKGSPSKSPGARHVGDSFASSEALIQHLDGTYPRLPSQYAPVSPTKRRAATAHIWHVGKDVGVEGDGTILVMLDQGDTAHSDGDERGILGVAGAIANDRGLGGVNEELRDQLVVSQRQNAELHAEMAVLKTEVKEARRQQEAGGGWVERANVLEAQISVIRTERDTALDSVRSTEEVQARLAEENQALQRRLWDLEQKALPVGQFEAVTQRKR